MKPLQFARPGEQMKVLCLGAHSDDIEIGAGATLLGLIARGVRLDVHWVVLSATPERAHEARSAAEEILQGAARTTIEVVDFRDAYFPYQGAELKAWLLSLAKRVSPDIIFSHCSEDAHQDHKLVADLTSKAFRDHLILGYEIPKWDGDLGRPSVYVPATAEVLERKLSLLSRHFGSQHCKDWYDRETFNGLARIRGMECRAPEHFAEAFHVRKIVLA